MRCPNCGRFSKEVRISEGNGKWAVYSECSECGRIFMERIEREGSEVKKKTDVVKVLLLILFVISAGLSGFSYYTITQNQLVIEDFQVRYSDLYDSYLTLVNTSSSIESYYNELMDMYSVLRSEYSELENMYAILLQEKTVLQDEFDELEEVVNFGKSIVFESNKTVELSPRGNMTLSYGTIYAGFIEVNFTASTDIYFWVGSSVSENQYFARYPPFPNTEINGTFKIPVCATVYININNPSEEIIAIVTLSIKYTY